MPTSMMLPLILPIATFQGTVRAEGTREPIAHARVEIAALDRAAFADPQGYFVIADVPEGRWEVQASALGYDTVRLTVVSSGSGGMRLDLLLPRRPVRLGEVPVETEMHRAAGGAAPAPRAGPAPARLAGPGQLKYIPGVAEPDVLRALQQLPSVAAISDFSSGLYVRGGAADQNLITLDGVPLFNPYHLGGVFSGINADAVAGVDVWAGALPASEGDRLSSAVRINTRDGSRDRMRASGAVGLISSNATVEGPVGSAGSYLVSARRTYLDAATRGLYSIGVIDNTMPYGFWDVLLKATHETSALGRLTFTGYLNRDGVDMPARMRRSTASDAQMGWGSRMASVAYRRPIGSRLTWIGRLAFTDFTGDFDYWEFPTSQTCTPSGCETQTEDTIHSLMGRTVARDLIAETDLSWHGRRHTVTAGARTDYYTFRHALETSNDDGLLQPFRLRNRRGTLATFIEDRWQVTDRLQVRGGMRLLHAGSLGTAWLPRLGARFRVLPGLTLTAGGGFYAQTVRSMRTDESAASSFLAYDVLTTQPVEAGLARGSDVVVGVDLEGASTSLRIEAYAKRMRALTVPHALTNPLDQKPLMADSFRIATGTARGVELTVRRTIGRIALQGAYTYAHTERSVDGETFVPRFARTHALDVGALVPWSTNGIFTVRATAGTGQPFTQVIGLAGDPRFDPITGTFEGPQSESLILGGHNAARLPAYFRIDVAARRDYDKRWFGRDMTLTPYIQVLNILNTRNTLLSDPQAFNQFYRTWPQLPIFPTFGLEWRF